MSFETPRGKEKENFTLKLVPVPYDDLPSCVIEKIEGRSRRFILPESYRERNFDTLTKHVHEDGDISYFASHNKTIDGISERDTYLIDTRPSDTEEVVTGYEEICLRSEDDKPYFKDKPFVAFSRTNQGFERQGLGRRRLIVADAYTQLTHGAPLHSDTILSNEARRVWERLVVDGLAESYMEGPNVRYRFLKRD